MDEISFRVVKEMHRSNPWALDWLKRYDKEDLKGLKTEQKLVDRPSCLKRQVIRLRKN